MRAARQPAWLRGKVFPVRFRPNEASRPLEARASDWSSPCDLLHRCALPYVLRGDQPGLGQRVDANRSPDAWLRLRCFGCTRTKRRASSCGCLRRRAASLARPRKQKGRSWSTSTISASARRGAGWPRPSPVAARRRLCCLQSGCTAPMSRNPLRTRRSAMARSRPVRAIRDPWRGGRANSSGAGSSSAHVVASAPPRAERHPFVSGLIAHLLASVQIPAFASGSDCLRDAVAEPKDWTIAAAPTEQTSKSAVNEAGHPLREEFSHV